MNEYQTTNKHVIRGGSWYFGQVFASADHRYHFHPVYSGGGLGFRLVQESEKGSARVIRGGSWFHYQGSARADCRAYYHPDYRDDLGGFRLVQEDRNIGR